MSAGAYTSIPDVIDYLVTLIQGLPECSSPVLVSDGWPGTYQPQTMVCIGGGPEDDEQNINRKFAVMGQGPNNQQEEFDILIYVRAWVGGIAVKPARDAAFTVFKAIEAAVRADMNLGGSIAHYYPAIFSAVALRQTPFAQGANGRSAEIRSLLTVTNRY